ncbi:MAG: 4-alpha-glucanotransferase, partial [bacterium]|nr:4-alpha-glucanotransferase [bacterium]
MTPEHEAAVRALADAVGIESSYADYFGREHCVDPVAQQRLLAAMGYAAADAAQARAARDALEWASWEEGLESVVTVDEGTPIGPIALVGESSAFDQLMWRLVEEDGFEHTGSVTRAATALLERREVGGKRLERRSFTLPLRLPAGYHRLLLGSPLAACAERNESLVIVAPAGCYLPPALQRGARLWGLALQLYALRSERNWGMGDFGDLRAAVALAKEQGAGFVGLNPLHELDPLQPADASPYAPFSRIYLDALYLDLGAIEEFASCEAAQALIATRPFAESIEALRNAPLVDYDGVALWKRRVLEMLFAEFMARHLGDPPSERGRAFWAFVREGGSSLERMATFQALRERMLEQDAGRTDWHYWPEPLRRPDSQAVAAFAAEHRGRVNFYLYLQWQAALQLGEAASEARRMPVGLYRDLAVGTAAHGADAWIQQGTLLSQISIGAPPDLLNPIGQEWGVAPFDPMALKRQRYAPFIELIRANMRHAGALRIDHAMGLMRLFVIPRGHGPRDGAYLRMPLEDLLRIVALESRRSHCIVVGEDLGTVPQGFRERLARAQILSCRLLYFEHDQAFRPLAPEGYPALAIASTGTHDLPTLAAYWLGADIELNRRLGLIATPEERARAADDRRRERAGLAAALGVAGRSAAAPSDADVDELARRAYAFLARTPCALLTVRVEDVLGQAEPVNVPGTTTAHPNWRRKLPKTLAEIASDPRLATLSQLLAATHTLPRPATVPISTYRLQFHRGFTFRDAARLVPYLHALGITHIYASPYLKARTGSAHGYDIIDHNALNPEIGSRADFEAMVARLHAYGMGQILDFVPNHMGIGGSENAWWLDTLEWGKDSPYAAFFDIDWRPARRDLRGKVLLPALGGHYGAVLERQELQLSFDPREGAFSVWYFQHRFPIAPRDYGAILEAAADAMQRRASADDEPLSDLRALAMEFSAFGRRGAGERSRDAIRYLVNRLKRRLSELAAQASVREA